MNTKHGSIYTSIEEEVRAFMRPFAPSVTIAQTFKGEGETVEQQQQQQAEVSPFAGIDRENLPADAKAAIEKAETEFANLQKATKEAVANATAKDLESRKHQARADRFQTVLKSHNLDGDKQQQQADPDAAEIQALADDFVKQMGLTPEVALGHAKMQHIAYKRGKADILKTVGNAVGPHIQTAQFQSIERLLTNAAGTEKYAAALSDPTIANGAREVLNQIVTGGGPVDETAIDTAIKLAMGEAAMKGNNPMQQQQQQQITQRVGTSIFNIPPMVRQDGVKGGREPVASDPETGKAASSVFAAMRRGLPSATKK